MTEIILIRGTQNAGKTTTCSLIYKELIEIAEKEHYFDYNKTNVDSIRYTKKGTVIDFIAKFIINGKVVIIVSAGDIAEDLKKILKAIFDEADIIICCARSINRKKTTYRMLQDSYKKNIVLEKFVYRSQKKEDKLTCKKEAVDLILKTIKEKLIK